MTPLSDPIPDAERIPHIVRHHWVQGLACKIRLSSRGSSTLGCPPGRRRIVPRGWGITLLVVEGIIHCLVDATHSCCLIITGRYVSNQDGLLMWRRVILQLLENIWGNLVLVAAGAVAGRCILWTRLFYHPPVHVENSKSEVTWSAILIRFDRGAACTVARKRTLVQKLTRDHHDFWPYSSFIMIARSVSVKPMFTQFCLLLAASPGFGEWKIAWPVQSRSTTLISIFW